MSKPQDVDELKKLRMAQLQEQMQRQYEQQMTEEAALEGQVNALENMVKAKMTKDALSRYGNVKTVHPEKAVQLLIVLGQLIQAGRIDTINDEQLKDILMKLTPPKHDFKIKRR